MKNSFKITLLAITILFFVGACKGNKSLNAGDSTKIDSSSISATAKSDTTKIDTSKAKADSVKAVKKKK
jgi:hypothetical protein